LHLTNLEERETVAAAAAAMTSMSRGSGSVENCSLALVPMANSAATALSPCGVPSPLLLDNQEVLCAQCRHAVGTVNGENFSAFFLWFSSHAHYLFLSQPQDN
jgi:hypothetical protein